MVRSLDDRTFQLRLAAPALRGAPVVEYAAVPGVVQSRFPAAVMDLRGGAAAGDEVRDDFLD